MPAKSKLKAIEEKYEKPAVSILQEFYGLYGNQTAVAKALGVSQGAVSTWLAILGLKEKTILVYRDKETDRRIA